MPKWVFLILVACFAAYGASRAVSDVAEHYRYRNFVATEWKAAKRAEIEWCWSVGGWPTVTKYGMMMGCVLQPGSTPKYGMDETE